METPHKSSIVTGVIPILVGINVYASTVVVRITAGRLAGVVPKPLHIWQDIAAVGYMWSVFLGPVALVIAVLAAALKFRRTRNAALTFFLSDALVVICFYVDPGHLVDSLVG
jgi:hypothetical protein